MGQGRGEGTAATLPRFGGEMSEVYGDQAAEPLVSVIMGAYNCADTLPSAMESILGQTYANLELVICDDGSEDATLQVARDWAARDSRVVVIENGSNRGLAATLNRCLGVARGDLVARMDGDDLCAPTRIRRQVDELASSPGVSVLGSAAHYFDNYGVWATSTVVVLPRARDLVRGTPFVHGSVMFRRPAIEAVGSYSEDCTRWRVEDFDLWVRLRAAGHHGMNLQEPLYALRNDRDAAGRRSIRARLNEARVIASAIRKLGLPPWNFLRLLRPIALGLLPLALYEVLYRWRHRSVMPTPRVISDGNRLTWADLLDSRVEPRTSRP